MVKYWKNKYYFI